MRSASFGCLAVSSIRSLFAPGLRISVLRSADRRARLAHHRAQLAQEGRQLARARLRHRHQLVEVVQRRAQVHERGVGLAQRVRQQLERARRAPRSRRRSRGRRCWCSSPGRPGRRGARRSRHRASRVASRTARSTSWSSASSRVRSLVLTRNGLKYLVASLACSPLPSYRSPEPRMTFCRPPRVSLVERVEERVEVHRRGRVVGADLPAVLDLLVAVGARAGARRSGWRCPTARWRGSSPWCPGAAARSRRRPRA